MTLKILTPAAMALAALALSACSGGENDVQTPASGAGSSSDTSSASGAAAVEDADAAGPSAEFAGLPEPFASADYDRGRRTYRLCQSCHTLAEGGANMVGPNLYGIFGRQAGSLDSFSYSPALQEAGFEWTPDKLDEWLENPRDFLPGNRMSFAGVRKPEDRTAVIAYIMAETGYSE